MSSTLSLNSLIPKLDLEQEKVRWNQINKVLTESKAGYNPYTERNYLEEK
jgi:hypothetical protein